MTTTSHRSRRTTALAAMAIPLALVCAALTSGSSSAAPGDPSSTGSTAALSPAAAKSDEPSTKPDRTRPQYLGSKAAVDAIEPVGDHVVVGGTGISGIKQGSGKVINGRNLSATTGAHTVTWTADLHHSAVWDLLASGDGHTFFVASTKAVWKFRVGAAKPIWRHALNGIAYTVERIPHTHYLIVGGDFKGGLMVLGGPHGHSIGSYAIPHISGTASPNGKTKIYRADVQPHGDRYVAVGDFSKVGIRTRSQIVMLTLGTTSAHVSKWDSPIAHTDFKGTGHDCSTAYSGYLRSIDWAPGGTWFVVDGSGGANQGICDSIARYNGTPASLKVKPAWVTSSCQDTFHSVSVSPQGDYILAGGHFKCVGKRGTKMLSRYGMVLLHSTGHVVRSWKSDKCRGVGAKEITWLAAGPAVGYDCTFWGNNEKSNPDPSKQFTLARFAVLPTP